jgi:arginyl-tRNA synthetase
MENFEPEALEDWRLWRRLSIEKYTGEYDRLNVHFDVYTGESEVSQEGMDKAVTRLEELGLIEESNGAKLIDLEKHNLGKAVIRKRGGFLFLLRKNQIGIQMCRWNFDISYP